MGSQTNQTIEQVLISLKLDLPTAPEQLKQMADSIASIKKSTEELTSVSEKNTEQKTAAVAATERQEKALTKNKEAIAAEADSISAIRKEIKQLTEVRNTTTTATEAGRQKIQQINKQLDEHNKTIKDNVDAYTKQKLSVGDYAGSLDKLVPGLGATVNGLAAMTKEAWAFVANPIGAVITAIGLGLSALIAYFKGSEEGQNRLNKIMLIGGTIMEKLKDVVENIGEALFDAFTNPKKAAQDLLQFLEDQVMNRVKAFLVIWEGVTNLDWKQATNGVLQLASGVEDVLGKTEQMWNNVTATISEAVAQGERLAALQAKWDKDERALIVSRAQTSLEVAKLREKALHEEGDARMATIQQAIDLEKQLSDAEVAHAKTKLEQAQLELQANGDDKEAKLAVADAEAAVIAAEAQRYEATLRFSKQIEAMTDAEAAAKKAAADKLAADEKKRNADELNDYFKNAEAEEKRAADHYKAVDDLDKKSAEARAKVAQTQHDTQTDLLNQLLGTQKVNYSQGFELLKKGALKSLIVDTEKAAVAAMASASEVPFVGFILGPLAYAATYAKGAASIATVAGLSLGFAKGGRVPAISGTRITSGHGIPITRANGDNRVATVKTGEIIANENQQQYIESVAGSDIWTRAGIPGAIGGGVIGGQIATRQALNTLETQGQAQALLNALVNMPQQILVLQDFEAAAAARDQAANKAVVIS
jgi:hypothetical protein